VRAQLELAGLADALVVLAGDGTLLAASLLLDKPIPVLGVNFGSLGFLTEITPADLYPALEGVIEGRFEHEERRLLRVVAQRRGRPDVTSDVLNDVVITKASPSRIIEVDVSVDELFVLPGRRHRRLLAHRLDRLRPGRRRADLHPTLPAVVVTPIGPHMLTNRPLVVGDEARIEVRLRAGRDVEVYAALERPFAFADGDHVVVTGSPRRLKLLKAPGRDYYEVLPTKLRWGDAGAPPRWT
jgi:NAD+ kinase